MANQPDFVPGLAGIPCAQSRVCFIDGSEGILQYRGFPIQDLAANCSFEETVHLLLFGVLPDADALTAFKSELAEARALPESVIATLRTLPKDGHPMDALTVAVSAMGMHFQGDHVKDDVFRRQCAIHLVAKLPTIVTSWHRVRQGLDPVAPRADLGHAANFLYMLEGEAPDELAAEVVDVALTLHAEHSMNASTFTGRVTASTLSDPFASVASAIGSLAGPLHGGANERVLATLRAIPDTSAEGVQKWAGERLANKDKIMGFGHRVYKVKDPRATILQGLATKMFEKLGPTPIYDVATRLETAMEALVGAKGIYPNVDFYSGIVYEKLEIPVDLFTPVFAIARVSGWLAHQLEQLDGNRIFRPSQIYVGDRDKSLTA